MVELDRLHWGPNWTPKPPEIFQALVADAAKGERWIIDGNYRGVRRILWPRATAVVWLDYPLPLNMRRAVSRSLRRSLSREVLWHGSLESFSRAFFSPDSTLLWTVRSHCRRRRQFSELKEENTYPQLSWLEFNHPRSTEIFLRGLKSSDQCERTPFARI